MWKFCLIITLAISFLSNAQTHAQSCDHYCDLAEAEGKVHASHLEFKASFFANDYDVKYQRMQWDINPAVRYISGNITTYLEAQSANLNSIHFDCSDSLTIDSAMYHGALVPVNAIGDNVIKIDLPGTIPMGSIDSLTVYYQGVPDATGHGSFVQAEHAGSPIIWTLSEPYGALDWWPCKQDLNDKIDSIDIFVTVPHSNLVGSQGLLMSSAVNGQDVTHHWKHRYPIPAYLISLAVTNYDEYTDKIPLGNDTLDVLNYVFPENLGLSMLQTPSIAPFIQLFDSLFGEYPYMDEKYGHAQFGWGGGMEHATMSSMANFNPGLMAHEVAHQWFGDKITCGSWSDIWLNEGFATYLTALTIEAFYPPEDWTAWKQGQIESICSDPGGSVFVVDTTDLSKIFSGRLSYSKGAMLLHMLRWKLSDSTFYQGVYNYITDPALEYNYASTDDLISHLEAASGESLTEFFDDWFYGEGYPSYTLTWSQLDGLVHLTIDQRQSHQSVDFFEIPVMVNFYGENQDTAIVFDPAFSGEEYYFGLDFELETLQFDREFWIISSDNKIQWEDPEPETNIVLYPNPSASGFTIKMPRTAPANVLVELFDVTGRQVHKENVSVRNTLPKFDLSFPNLRQGTYFVKVSYGVFSTVKEWVKGG